MDNPTPGPWEARPEDDCVCQLNGGEIAYVRGGNASANARLIAAAPYLLEIANRARWLLAQKLYPGWERDAKAIHDEADAAIAKALGQPVQS